jgi:hypothetical protein
MKINRLSRIFMIFVLIITPSIFFGQIGINSTGVPPSPDAMLDVKSSNKGILIPLQINSTITMELLGLRLQMLQMQQVGL